MNFKNKKVLIMGLGIIGKGLQDALFFYQQGAQVTVTDLKDESELKDSVQKLKKYKDIKLHLGQHLISDFKENDIIVRNPAIAQDSPFLKIARDNQKKIVMEDSLFASLTEAPLIGITGTRGKTTSASLVYEILKYAGYDVYLSGNVRGSASLPLLNKIKKKSYVVLELSSWQLQGFADEQVSPQYAAITNIYEDHLNRYSTMSDYVNDKKNIYRFQKESDFLFLNKDMNQKYLTEFKSEAISQKIYFSKDDLKFYKTNLIGEHNLENIAVARAITLKIGVSEEVVRRVVSNFSAIEFRLEKVRKVKGVNFINDSASTTPIATIKALNSLTTNSGSKNILLIAGGASKNLSLEKLASEIKAKCRQVVLLSGNGTTELQSLLPVDLIAGVFDNLELAVKSLYQNAQNGDNILLSPGFASFGMFRNEFDRGEQFDRIVKQL